MLSSSTADSGRSASPPVRACPVPLLMGLHNQPAGEGIIFKGTGLIFKDQQRRMDHFRYFSPIVFSMVLSLVFRRLLVFKVNPSQLLIYFWLIILDFNDQIHTNYSNCVPCLSSYESFNIEAVKRKAYGTVGWVTDWSLARCLIIWAYLVNCYLIILDHWGAILFTT